MDKTDDDKEIIKSWYKDAEAIQKQYAVEEFPTFLFLILMDSSYNVK